MKRSIMILAAALVATGALAAPVVVPARPAPVVSKPAPAAASKPAAPVHAEPAHVAAPPVFIPSAARPSCTEERRKRKECQ